MYWLGGLEQVGEGHLFTFEPNSNWTEIAEVNLNQISDKYTLTIGTFEDNAKLVLKDISVSMAFIDAIHTSDFVFSQYKILSEFLAPGGLVLFDDINFSEDMQACWIEIAHRPEVAASAVIGGRVGMIEVKAS